MMARGLDRQIGFRHFGLYLAKAIPLVLLLLAVGLCAPIMPSWAIAIVLVIYALISTIGGLYFTVVNRLYRQFKLAESGNLSRLNRRWTIRLVILFALSLISAFFFVLQSPKWDVLEWALTMLAVPLYFLVFVFARNHLKQEFAPSYCKANAMWLSFWIVGIVLGLAYAALSLQGMSYEYTSLRQAFDSAAVPYEAAPSALMNEADKLSSFADGLSAFALMEASGFHIFIAFICRFIIYVSVFLGLMNQFGFCLLGKAEIKAEFKLLPARHEKWADQPLMKRYIITLSAFALVFCTLFVWADKVVAHAQQSDQYTKIEAFVNDQKDQLVYAFDGGYEKAKQQEELMREYEQKTQQLLSERNGELGPLLNQYYDRCLDNVDAYLDWRDNVLWQLVRNLKWFGTPVENLVRDNFIKVISQGTNESSVQEVYARYADRLTDLATEMRESFVPEGLDGFLSKFPQGETAGASPSLDLWMPLKAQDDSWAMDILLDTSSDRETLRASAIKIIEAARADALASLD